MATITAEGVFKSDDQKKVKVTISEWGGDVYFKTIGIDERLEFAKFVEGCNDGGKDDSRIKAKLIILTACTKSGKPIFKGQHLTKLAVKNTAILTRCFQISKRLNYLGDEYIEELEKN